MLGKRKKQATQAQMKQYAKIIRANTDKTCSEIVNITFLETGDIRSSSSVYHQALDMGIKLSKANVNAEYMRNPLSVALLANKWEAGLCDHITTISMQA